MSQGFDFLKDGQSSGALSRRFAELFEMSRENDEPILAPLTIDPGDVVFTGGPSESFSLSLPIAYDVWYLWGTVNIIDPEKLETFRKVILSHIFENHKTPQILRTVLKESIEKDILPTVSFFQQKGVYYIKEMRFETFLHDKSPEWTSDGPSYINHKEINHDEKGIADIYAGYLAFPIGPLGVMMTLSIISQSLLADKAYQVNDNSLDVIAGEELLTPIMEQNNNCMGKHLIETGYLLADRDVEYPAKKMEREEAILPHHWLRFWLNAEAKWPIPGEFVCMLCKPIGLPPHCWWYQETSPFIYSGNFFETEYYTSGFIMAIIEITDTDFEKNLSTYKVTSISDKYIQQKGLDNTILHVDDIFEDREEVCNIYKVRIKDQDVFILSSDFLEYEIDQQVAVRKIPETKTKNFNWKDLAPGKTLCGSGVMEELDYANKMSDKPFELNTDWAIVPITFYKE